MIIQRKYYLEKIKKYIDIDIIKVITGIRRSWKTYFMLQIINLLKKRNINTKNIIYIDKENLDFDYINTYIELNSYIKKQISWLKWKIYLFIDEIQEIKAWEKTIRSYAKNQNFDIYITGSNSDLLSSELSTFLTWRYVDFHIYPLNFKEFLIFRKKTNKNIIIKQEFENFIKFWWLPVIHKLDLEEELIYSHIWWIFNSILFKDLISRYNIRNSSLLLDIFKFLSSNIWSIVSTKKISDYLKKEKINIWVETLREYLSYFSNTFLLNKVQRYDLNWKKYLNLFEKYYLWDIWFKNYLLWFSKRDIWYTLENIVYLELKNRWYNIYIWKIWDKEIDFVAKKNWKIEYYQVVYLLESDKTIKREFWNLEKIKDNYPKYVLSMDEFFDKNYKWIHRINIIDWLLW